MEAPKNLVEAVNRIRPQAILLLDTNTIMRPPRLELYEINAEGPFLLVVPHLMAGVGGELISIELGNEGKAKGELASRARRYLGKLYERGDPEAGIDLGNGRWLITVYTPKPDRNDLEDQRARRNLGPVDSALLRLARACVQDNLDTATLLITHDRPLTRHAAKAAGFSVCQLRDLRKQETLNKLLMDASPMRRPDPQDPFENHIDSDEERAAKISMTLEELRSDSDYLIARGSGRLTDGEERYPFRWTFPYQNLAVYKDLSTIDIHEFNEMVMPIDNIDFMGADERITEPVKRLVCNMLEESGGWSDPLRSLQSPQTVLCFNIELHTAMGTMKSGWERWGAEYLKAEVSPESVERFEELFDHHLQLRRSLTEGTPGSTGRIYQQLFQVIEELEVLLGGYPDENDEDHEYEYDEDHWDLETSLIKFLDISLSTWTVGETREVEDTYLPFASLEEEEEASADDEEEMGEETE